MRPGLRWIVISAALIAACGPESGDDAGSSGETASDDDTATGATPTSGATEAPWEQVPDCEAMSLPGDPADLAASPRPDRDAEVLALAVDPNLPVARQSHYELVLADLAAIRAIDPPLADLHVGPNYPDALELWFPQGAPSPLDAFWAGTYRAWDCLNAHYGGADYQPLDNYGFLLPLDGVYGEPVRDAYAALPGLEQAAIARSSTCIFSSCGFTGSIALTATLSAEGDPTTREYRFEPKDGAVRTYRVIDGEAPMLVE